MLGVIGPEEKHRCLREFPCIRQHWWLLISVLGSGISENTLMLGSTVVIEYTLCVGNKHCIRQHWVLLNPIESDGI